MRNLIAILLLSLAASATTIYPTGTKTVAECAFATTPLQAILINTPYPSDWKIVIACTAGEWDAIKRHMDATQSESAFTVRGSKVTVINGRIFNERIYNGPEFTVKHELGHILCNTAVEELADYYAEHGTCKLR